MSNPVQNTERLEIFDEVKLLPATHLLCDALFRRDYRGFCILRSIVCGICWKVFWPSNSRCLCYTVSLHLCSSPLRIFRFTLNLILQSRKGGVGSSSRSGTYSVRSENLSCVGTKTTIAGLSIFFSLLLGYKLDAYLSLICCLFQTVAFRESIG